MTDDDSADNAKERKAERHSASKPTFGPDADLKIPRPSDFMRRSRPTLFSDSRTISEPRADPRYLEYILDTLTSRKEETQFEHFARKLAEKELCPNLRPQTGPTGGGDSKVDSETYPVAKAITTRWYEGDPEAGQQPWAFAFSAKKKWQGKARLDVDNVLSTGRPYTHIYFITSQFAADKKRAALEDELTKKAGRPVKILDRSWIVDRVFKNKRIALAVETLGMTSAEALPTILQGPRDLERTTALAELDKQIDDVNRYVGVEYQLAEDCLQSALLARGLERPRQELDGRFGRARRAAADVGVSRQRLRIAYSEAWTAYWWHDDFKALNRLYDAVEAEALAADSANDCHLLFNLFLLLMTSVRTGGLSEEDTRIAQRLAALREQLNRLAKNKTRPTNALEAHSMLLLLDLHTVLGNSEKMEPIFLKLKRVVADARGMAAFEFRSLAAIIAKMGNIASASRAYNELFEATVEHLTERDGEASAGHALLERGTQLLRAEKKYDAIRFLGRSQRKLALNEQRAEFVLALSACGHAYDLAGLPWAARTNFLAAASVAMRDFGENSEMARAGLIAIQGLIWIELQLGRVPAVLQWIELASLVARHLMLAGDRKQTYIDQRTAQDRGLAILILRTEPLDLKHLGFLPSILEKLGLFYSYMALMYVLGHEAHLRSEGWIPDTETPESAESLFERWLEQPAGAQLPRKPEYLLQQHITLRSRVLGAHLTVTASNNSVSLRLGESLLSAIEAFYATSLLTGVTPYLEEMEVRVRPSSVASTLPSITIVEEGGLVFVDVIHGPTIDLATRNDVVTFRKWIIEAVTRISVRFTLMRDWQAHLQRLVVDEDAFSRAGDFSNVDAPLQNLLGSAERISIADWESLAGEERFSPTIAIPWPGGAPQKATEPHAHAKSPHPKLGAGDVPLELATEVENLPHNELRIVSLIDIPLWDRAKWRAAAYGYTSHAPFMALGFRDADAARQIFLGLRRRVGTVDEDELIRISLIRGIRREAPAAYMVLIGSNVRLDQSSRFFASVTRPLEVTARTPGMLDQFLKAVEAAGRYELAPAVQPDENSEPQFLTDLGIMKTKIEVRDAWEIGRHDPDQVGLPEDIDPIIPPGVKDAPVLEVLKWRKERKGRRKA
jgi:hypothetical protein